MKQKRNSAEKSISKLREAEVLLQKDQAGQKAGSG